MGFLDWLKHKAEEVKEKAEDVAGTVVDKVEEITGHDFVITEAIEHKKEHPKPKPQPQKLPQLPKKSGVELVSDSSGNLAGFHDYDRKVSISYSSSGSGGGGLGSLSYHRVVVVKENGQTKGYYDLDQGMSVIGKPQDQIGQKNVQVATINRKITTATVEDKNLINKRNQIIENLKQQKKKIEETIKTLERNPNAFIELTPEQARLLELPENTRRLYGKHGAWVLRKHLLEDEWQKAWDQATKIPTTRRITKTQMSVEFNKKVDLGTASTMADILPPELGKQIKEKIKAIRLKIQKEKKKRNILTGEFKPYHPEKDPLHVKVASFFGNIAEKLKEKGHKDLARATERFGYTLGGITRGFSNIILSTGEDVFTGFQYLVSPVRRAKESGHQKLATAFQVMSDLSYITFPPRIVGDVIAKKTGLDKRFDKISQQLYNVLEKPREKIKKTKEKVIQPGVEFGYMEEPEAKLGELAGMLAGMEAINKAVEVSFKVGAEAIAKATTRVRSAFSNVRVSVIQPQFDDFFVVGTRGKTKGIIQVSTAFGKTTYPIEAEYEALSNALKLSDFSTRTTGKMKYLIKITGEEGITFKAGRMDDIWGYIDHIAKIRKTNLKAGFGSTRAMDFYNFNIGNIYGQTLDLSWQLSSGMGSMIGSSEDIGSFTLTKVKKGTGQVSIESITEFPSGMIPEKSDFFSLGMKKSLTIFGDERRATGISAGSDIFFISQKLSPEKFVGYPQEWNKIYDLDWLSDISNIAGQLGGKKRSRIIMDLYGDLASNLDDTVRNLSPAMETGTGRGRSMLIMDTKQVGQAIQQARQFSELTTINLAKIVEETAKEMALSRQFRKIADISKELGQFTKLSGMFNFGIGADFRPSFKDTSGQEFDLGFGSWTFFQESQKPMEGTSTLTDIGQDFKVDFKLSTKTVEGSGFNFDSTFPSFEIPDLTGGWNGNGDFGFPKITFPEFPGISSGSLLEAPKYKRPPKRVRTKTEYKPSLVAVMLDIESTEIPRLLSGLEVRPIIRKRRGKRR